MMDTMELIENAIQDIDTELAAHSEGRGTVSNEAQLKEFRACLERMISELRGESQGVVQVGMGHVIADSWPYTSALGEAIVKAEQAFVRVAR